MFIVFYLWYGNISKKMFKCYYKKEGNIFFYEKKICKKILIYFNLDCDSFSVNFFNVDCDSFS